MTSGKSTSGPTTWTNPWYALRRAKVLRYASVSFAVLAISFGAASITCNWTWIARAGGVVILFGILLSLRRLFRLGPDRLDEPTQPALKPGSGPLREFNLAYMTQGIERSIDNYAQISGVVLMAIGTALASYGDVALAWLLPFQPGCGG